MQVLSWLFGTFAATALVACTGLSQVPATQPHGVLHLRLVKVGARKDDDVEVALDQGSPVPLTEEAMTLRLAPGRHVLRFGAITRQYTLGEKEVSVPVCANPPECSRYNTAATLTERQLGIVEQRRRVCDETLNLEITRNQESVAVFVLEEDATCEACSVGSKDDFDCS